MNNKIKLYGGAVLVISLMACSGKNTSSTNLSSLNSKSLSAKNFLLMDSDKQQEVINHFQTSCDQPAIMAGSSDNLNLQQYSKDDDFCFKICKINLNVIGNAQNGTTRVQTLQTVVGISTLNQYVDLEDRDNTEDIIGECESLPPCMRGGTVIPMSGTESPAMDLGVCTELPRYIGPPIMVESH